MKKLRQYLMTTYPFILILYGGFIPLASTFLVWHNTNGSELFAWLLLGLLPFSLAFGHYLAAINRDYLYSWIMGTIIASFIPLFLYLPMIVASFVLSPQAKLYILFYYGWVWLPLILNLVMWLFYLTYYAHAYLPTIQDKKQLQVNVYHISFIILGNLSIYVFAYFIPWLWPVWSWTPWLVSLLTMLALMICITRLFKACHYLLLWVILSCAWMLYSATEWVNGFVTVVSSPFSFLAKLESILYEPRLMFNTVGLFCGFMILLTVFDRSAFVSAIAERRLKQHAKKNNTFGSARFSTDQEKNKLTQGPGVIVGQISAHPQSAFIRIPLEGHMLIFAPPRSGKLVHCISPNLATAERAGWKGPIISIDPKGETFAIWARQRRALGHNVILIDPFAITQHFPNKNLNIKPSCYNPLDFIDVGDQEMVRQIGALADALIVPHDHASSADLHFYESAKTIIEGFIAWTLISGDHTTRHLNTVRDYFLLDEDSFKDELAKMMSAEGGFGLPLAAVAEIIKVGDRERGSMMSTVLNALNFLKYPQLFTHLKTSDFSLTELLDGNTDIFVVAPGDMLKDIKTWLRMWVTLPLKMLTKPLYPKKRILLWVDELAALGRIEGFKTAFNLGPGYGFSVAGLTQHQYDFEAAYGEKDARGMIGMAQIVQYFNISPSDLVTQKYVSDLLGDTTITVKSHSTSKGRSDAAADSFRKLGSTNQSDTINESKRPLLTPNETAQLPGNRAIIFAKKFNEPLCPILAYIISYFSRKEFAGLYDDNPYPRDVDINNQ